MYPARIAASDGVPRYERHQPEKTLLYQLLLKHYPACEPDDYADSAAKVSGFSLHAGVSARADERKKLERLSAGGPAATSVGQPLRKSGFRLRQAATSATS